MEVTVTTILSNITEFFTAAMGWMGDVTGEVVSNPLLLIMVACVPLAGYGVGLTKRLISL